MFKKLFFRIIDACGYSLISKSRYDGLREAAYYKPKDDAFHEHLRRLLQKYQVNTVLDVGASGGEYAESLRNDVGYEGWIHSFEPLPHRQAMLESKVAKDPRWVLHKCALGAQPGEAEFNVTSSDVFSSFLEPDPSQPSKYADSNLIVDKVKVRIRTVAEMFPEIMATSGPGPAYLKMDTQGFDLQVFQGAAGVLDQIVGLQSELALKTIYAQAPDWKVMMGAVEKAGYVPSFLLPISIGEDLTIVEVDGIFVRPPKAA